MRRLLWAWLLMPGLVLAQSTRIIGPTGTGTTGTAKVTNAKGLQVDPQIANVSAACTVNATGGFCSTAMAGKAAIGVQVTAISAPSGITVIPEASLDGGTTWKAITGGFIAIGTNIVSDALASFSVGDTYSIAKVSGATHYRLNCTARTSGTVTLQATAAENEIPVRAFLAQDTVQSGCLLNAADATCTVPLAGKSSAGFVVTATSTPSGIILVSETSRDGTNWDGHPMSDASTGDCISVVPNASLAVGFGKTLVLAGGDRYARIRVRTYTSGSITVTATATDTTSPTCINGVDRGSYAINNSTATTSTLVIGPQSCTANAAPWSCCTAANTGATCVVYVTSAVYSASVASTTTSNQQLIIQYGTGSTCGTGTTFLTGAFGLALGGFAAVGGQVAAHKVPAGSNVCWIHAAAGNKTVSVTYTIGS